ncbi:hypothetical protein AZE42_13786, partial [Rhizopogon vesiculosus]
MLHVSTIQPTTNAAFYLPRISKQDDSGFRYHRCIAKHSQLMIPDLETPYSRFPNPDQYQASQLTEQNIDAILTERQGQLNAILRNIPAFDTVMNKIQNIFQQLVKDQHMIAHSMNLHRGYK